MKFFLIKDADEVANAMYWSGKRMLPGGNTRVGWRPGYYRSTTRTLEIIPISWDSLEVEKCALLRKFLEAEVANTGGAFWTCKVDVGVSETEYCANAGTRQSTLEIFFKRSFPDRDCLGQMFLSLPESKVDVEWTMVDHRDRVVGKISTTDFKRFPNRMFHNSLGMTCPVENFKIWRNPSQTVFNRMTIAVTIPDNVFSEHCGSIVAPTPKTLLEEGTLSDVTILCGDGTKIKAHRLFLMARSPVFMAMFQTNMMEARESIVKILDMEAKSVQALLKFLYYGDTKDAEEDVKVALELFQAGHKYDIQFLEEKMRRLIMQQPKNWFDREIARKLFMFARILTPPDEQLKKKMAKVLQL